MTALFMPQSTWAPPQHSQRVVSQPRQLDANLPVAYSVAEAALKSGPNSPSFGQSMTSLMDAPPLGATHWAGNPNVTAWPRVKTRRVASFAGRGRPLWEVVEHAKERRGEKKTPSSPSIDFAFQHESSPFAHGHSRPVSHGLGLAAEIDDFAANTYQDVTILTTRSADPSPVDSIDTAFAHMAGIGHGRPRMSARDFAAAASSPTSSTPETPRTPSSSHTRTMSDRSPSQVLRSQATPTAATPRRAIARMPSLAQIQAKMNRSPDLSYRGNSRSDSMDSQDSDAPRTPTDELSSFEYAMHNYRPATPPSPTVPATAAVATPGKAPEPRLAAFLHERTNCRLARPKSMPPLAGDLLVDFYPSPLPADKRHGTFPLDRPSSYAATRQGSLPCTPQSRRYMPIRTWSTGGNDDVLSPSLPKVSFGSKEVKDIDTPTSPTESVFSSASSVPSLPIITCTPAVEADSDEESEGDVIVFSGELEDVHDDDDEEQVERQKIGREMLSRLSRRASEA